MTAPFLPRLAPGHDQWVDYLRRVAGRNWVLAHRRSSGIVARYGDDVVVLTPAAYARHRADWVASLDVGPDPLAFALDALDAGHRCDLTPAELASVLRAAMARRP